MAGRRHQAIVSRSRSTRRQPFSAPSRRIVSRSFATRLRISSAAGGMADWWPRTASAIFSNSTAQVAQARLDALPQVVRKRLIPLGKLGIHHVLAPIGAGQRELGQLHAAFGPLLDAWHQVDRPQRLRRADGELEVLFFVGVGGKGKVPCFVVAEGRRDPGQLTFDAWC